MTVAGKKVPAIPSSVGAVVLLVAMVLLVRACVGAGSSAAWCDDLDTAIDQGWNSDGGANDGGRHRRHGLQRLESHQRIQRATQMRRWPNSKKLSKKLGLPVAATTAKKVPEPGRTPYATLAEPCEAAGSRRLNVEGASL